MLRLSRKPGTSIEVDGPARFTVIGIHRGQVQVGIEADSHVHIVRSELLHPPLPAEAAGPIEGDGE
jgi:carbon storage regulator CsrA